MNADTLIPTAIVREIVEKWARGYDSLEDACQALGARTGLHADTWRKRFSDTPGYGWWRFDGLDLGDVDELLAAIDRPDAWFVELAALTKTQALTCEDCSCTITRETGYRPLDLMRPDPDAPAAFKARAGGRRFRVVDLCRKCAGEALRQRSIGHTVKSGPYKGRQKGAWRMEDGKRVYLKRRDRIPPKRGGRPRLLTDEQIRAAHVVYERHGLSMRDLAERLHATSYPGTVGGLAGALFLGFRRLNLPTRNPGLAVAVARFGTDGTKTKRWKVQCQARLRGGRRCTQWTRRVVTETNSRPAADGLCWTHAQQAERLAA